MRTLALLVWTLAAPLGAATLTVNTADDTNDGTCDAAHCSLREAMIAANATPEADTIVFALPGSGVHTITLGSQLPEVLTPMTIDGYTQPGSQPNTNSEGALNSILQIEIDCNGANKSMGTLSALTIRGLAIGNCGAGLDVAIGTTLTFAGNYMGTDATGTSRRQNTDGISIWTQLGGATLTIGGPDPGDRNLISGSVSAGIFVGGNFNGFDGLTVQGNVIGLDRSATTPIPNAYGIIFNGLAPASATIGGINPGEGNLISGNSTAGISVGSTVHVARIRGNSIFGNGLKGIDLSGSPTSPLVNDPSDADDGGNDLQNFPVLSSVSVLAPAGAGTRIQGILHSKPSTAYDLDFYENPACANFPREFLQGQSYIGSGAVTTDGTGAGVFDVTVPISVATGARISATATDPDGNTSEFSQRILFSMSAASGPSSGGAAITVFGTDFADPTSLSFGGTPATATFVDSHTLTTTSPALQPGTVYDVIATTAEGASGTLVKGWVSDFLDVPQGHQFYSFATTLVSNAITVGVGGGLYGVDQPTLRQQMAVFLMKALHGLCYVPPPCTTQVFTDVPCASTFAPWINELVTEGITGGCGTGTYCPADPVKRQQMAVLLLKTFEGLGYTPPACVTATFGDVPCDSPFAPWIYELVARTITGGCGGGNYCPADPATRGQMAVFVVKTFSLQ